MKIGDFEKNMADLENIVKQLEKGSLSLEESLKLFERGVKISADGMKLLDESEAKLQKLAVFEDADQDAAILDGDGIDEDIV